jgi:hypothetical protein
MAGPLMKESTEYPKWKKRIDILTFGVNLLTFGAAIVTAVFFYWQLEAMQDAPKLDQRAWIGPVDIIHENADFFREFTVPLANFGKTPALRMSTDLFGDSFPSNRTLAVKDITYRLPESSNGPFVVYPGQRHNVVAHFEYSPEKAAAIISGKEDAYIWGYANYFDIFGVEHHTKWCRRWRPTLKVFESCLIYNSPD